MSAVGSDMAAVMLNRYARKRLNQQSGLDRALMQRVMVGCNAARKPRLSARGGGKLFSDS